ncbi:hypothetical protein QQF64_023186 [Cirrhinus molitorella]|uniref:Uncharacterized protein n=1 Tax=Cirrhinus molitorella TaxID=172907 RepID=A0ABR3L630_9TELE
MKLEHLGEEPSTVCPPRLIVLLRLSHPRRMPADILNPSVYSTDHVPRPFAAHLPPTFSCCSKPRATRASAHQKDLPGRGFRLKEHPGRRQAF